jgi:nucleoside-diphosphate-sugar epimerase
VLDAAKRGVRASLIRLAPTVHGRGDHQFVPYLIQLARQKGFAGYVGDGSNRWPAVHRLDAARLFRLAVEKATPGTRLHGVAEEGIPMRIIAETIGQMLGVPARSVAAKDAPAHFDWMNMFVAIDNPTSSTLTREALGWQPEHPGLVTDLQEAGYFS